MNRPLQLVLLAGLIGLLSSAGPQLSGLRSAEPDAAGPSGNELTADKLSAATVTVRTIPARALVGNYLTNNSAASPGNSAPATSGGTVLAKDAPAKETTAKPTPQQTPPATANSTAPAGNGLTENYRVANGGAAPNNLSYNNSAYANFDNNNNNDAVTVCSGVAVGKGLVVTFSGTPGGAITLNGTATNGTGLNSTAGNNTANGNPAAGNTAAGNTTPGNGLAANNFVVATQAPRYRVTLPDGQQAKATLRVTDHYSGLSLLDIGDAVLPALEISTALPRVGSTVLSAAASGIERPVVSMGIISSIDRSLPGSDFPPLLQCDLHTTETSSGAALVDKSGKLIGIIVATSATGQASGWTFAVPARHVQRLIDAGAKAKDTPGRPDAVTILERRRPSVGLTMGPGTKEGTVEVEHVVAGGAAERAGVQKGDLVLEAEGRKIRSAYQAVDLVLNRQPGEKIELVVQRGDERKSLSITLEGAGSEPASQQQSNYDSPQAQVGPQIAVRRDQQTNQIEIRNNRSGGEQNGIVTPRGGPAYGNIGQQGRAPADDAAALRMRLSMLERETVRLQQELARRDQHEAQAAAEREALREEVARLRKELEAGKQ